MLCDQCKEVQRQLETGFNNYPERFASSSDAIDVGRYPSYQWIEASSRRGCDLCTLLCSHPTIEILDDGNVLLPNAREIEPSQELQVSFELKHGRNAMSLTIACPRSPYEDHHREVAAFEFYRHRDDSPNEDDHKLSNYDQYDDEPIPERSIVPNPCSDCSMSIIRGWLDMCTSSEEHYLCCWPPSQVRLPSRVVHVGPPDGSQEPFLLVTEGQEGTYLALSHCWGHGSKPNMTRTDNISEMQTQISMKSLSANLRDAVIVCRKLGFKFLWIDSLCILQDDAKDWAIESANMVNIYRNSYLTIAASSSDSSEKGFLQFRETDTPSYHFKIRTNYSPREETVYIRRNRTGYYENPDNMKHSRRGEARTMSYLDERAWCFQESLLSTRVVKFCEDQIYWECGTCNEEEGSKVSLGLGGSNVRSLWPRRELPNQKHSEDILASDEPATFLTPSETRMYMHPSDYFNPNDRPNRMRQLVEAWDEVVRDFTQRKLTYSSDKLPALSGLARDYQAISGDQYVVGLWRSMLPRALLWSGDRNLVALAVPWRAPSWSWSAYDGMINPCGGVLVGNEESRVHGNDGENKLEIMDISIGLANSDPFGRVSHARLLVNGLQRTAIMTHRFEGYGRLPDFITDPVNASNCNTKFDCFIEPAEGSTFIFLQVFTWEVHKNKFGVSFMRLDMYMLILECVDAEQNIYKRVGISRLSDPLSRDLAWERRTITLI